MKAMAGLRIAAEDMAFTFKKETLREVLDPVRPAKAVRRACIGLGHTGESVNIFGFENEADRDAWVLSLPKVYSGMLMDDCPYWINNHGWSDVEETANEEILRNVW